MRPLRFAAYKQFTWWIYQPIGKGNRQVIPSCVLWCIRSVYEERDGTHRKEVAAFGDITTQQKLPAQSYNRNTGRRCKIRSNLAMKTQERRYQRRSGVFFVTFEHISQLILLFLLLTLNR